uniref:glycosyl hydrolase 2 galactose-binding domain-containing protein n=1 Tax=Flavobacterium sp. TaxID=239 RepID=UPI00404A221D
NEKDLQWIENENWEYETNFFISNKEFTNQNIDLEFEGLDTYATVFLNGKVILDADNMFRKWTVEAKKQLKNGDNHLKIVFYSAVKRGQELAKKLTYTLPEKERVFVRKAQYQFGWDWAPRFVTAGIWKPIQLKFWNSFFLQNVKFSQTFLNEEKATLTFEIEILTLKSESISLEINEKAVDFDLKKGTNVVKIPYQIENPKLWWCNGLGESNLYPFEIKLLQNNQIFDAKQLNIGLKTIELVQEKDAAGTSFYFKLNGKPVFIKGANLVPPDSFLPRVSDSTYISLVENAKKANMNMLRVWGGGVYPDNTFYEACDVNGILVWQDFMFACAMYPGDEKFIDNAKQEVIDNVIRLQNHASLTLWCGNNENSEGWHNWGWQKQFNYTKADSTKIWNDYQKVFHELIPNTLAAILPQEKNIYWPSSPSLGWGRKESLTQGDVHYWGVWWGKEPFEMYETKVGRFVSEYGFQGMPDVGILKKSMNPEDFNFSSLAFKNHQKHPTGFKTIREYMKRDFPIPANLEDFAYVSQLLQAHGMKIAMEAHRRNKPNCMGTLYWQLNDCWPATSWSSLDYDGNWKAFHYQTQRSYENLLISFNSVPNHYQVHFNNDSFDFVQGTLKIELQYFDGKTLWEISKNVSVEENSSVVLHEIPKEQICIFSFEQSSFDCYFKRHKILLLLCKTKGFKVGKTLHYYQAIR